jgi:Carbonic anhydrase
MIQSRREFVCKALATAAAAGVSSLVPTTASRAQTTLSPEGALQQLIDGNRRFAEGHLTSFTEDLDILKSKTAEKQEPFAAVLSCADSRVPVELIFDQSIGHVFVTRVAGNVATSAIIASLEYGVAVLGTKAIMVLGHANQRTVSPYPPSGRPGRVRSGGGDKGQRQNPSGIAAAILAGSGRSHKRESTQNRRRVLRFVIRHGYSPGLSCLPPPEVLSGRRGGVGVVYVSSPWGRA